VSTLILYVMALGTNAPYFVILFCVTAEGFTLFDVWRQISVCVRTYEKYLNKAFSHARNECNIYTQLPWDTSASFDRYQVFKLLPKMREKRRILILKW
jgi:hypothetical protein